MVMEARRITPAQGRRFIPWDRQVPTNFLTLGPMRSGFYPNPPGVRRPPSFRGGVVEPWVGEGRISVHRNRRKRGEPGRSIPRKGCDPTGCSITARMGLLTRAVVETVDSFSGERARSPLEAENQGWGPCGLRTISVGRGMTHGFPERFNRL